MKNTTKIILLALFALLLASVAYSAYAFVEFVWFLLPTGVLLSCMLLAPVVAAGPLKLTPKKQQELMRKQASSKGAYSKSLTLPRFVWIGWSVAASVFITFFNGFLGNIVWCTCTLILLAFEVYQKRKKLALEELKTNK